MTCRLSGMASLRVSRGDRRSLPLFPQKLQDRAARKSVNGQALGALETAHGLERRRPDHAVDPLLFSAKMAFGPKQPLQLHAMLEGQMPLVGWPGPDEGAVALQAIGEMPNSEGVGGRIVVAE